METLLATLALGLLAQGVQAPEAPPDPRATLAETLARGGVRLDLEQGFLALEAEVLIRRELLEYLLVRPNGAVHESLLMTRVDPALLNAALLALGAEPGTNAVLTPVDPPPSAEARREGAPVFDVRPPAGHSFALHVGWREGSETFFYRAEDLVANLATGRSMRRQQWVYLGSRFVPLRDGGEAFAAAQYGNLINISFFQEGHTLLTATLPECVEQTIWAPVYWLLPEEGRPVALFVSLRPLERAPAGAELWLPDVARPRADGEPAEEPRGE